MTSLYLSHHGVKGMKWGVRRYQNKDGSLTLEGKSHAESDILSKYGEMVVSKGFNAVVDDGGRTVGELPLILFTSNTTLNKQGAKQVDKYIEEQSRALYSMSDAKKYRSKTASI